MVPENLPHRFRKISARQHAGFRLFTLPAKVIVLPAKVIVHARQLFARVAARLLAAADVLAIRARLLALVFA